MNYEIIKRMMYNTEDNSYTINSIRTNDSMPSSNRRCWYISRRIKKLPKYTDKEKLDISILVSFIEWIFWSNTENKFTIALKNLLNDDEFIRTRWSNTNEYYNLIAKYLFKN